MTDGAWVGFKYFRFTGTENAIAVSVRGTAVGTILVSTALDGAPAARISVRPADTFAFFSAPFKIKAGVHPLFFRYEGNGAFDFDKFEIEM